MKPTLLILLLCGAVLTSTAAPPAYFPTTSQTAFKLGGWYPQHLHAMREPSLHQHIAAPIEEYRFLYLPTFHHPISIRVTQSGQSISLRAVMLSGKGGYEPGRILTERKRALTTKEWSRFQSLLSRASFWQRPVPDDPMGCDGSQWVLEGTGSYRYRFLDVWTPTYDTRKRGLGSYVECSKYLLSLSGLQPDDHLY